MHAPSDLTPAVRVTDLTKTDLGWEVTVKNLATGECHHNNAKFVFVGAGGGSLGLLQKSGIPEAKGLGGFPIGGQWLVCDNPEIVARHEAKVYGQPLDSAPTMAVPHLDTRYLDGKKTLLFGPFAAWTTKFLNKKGNPFSIVVGKPVPPDALDGEPGEVTARLQQHTVEALRADRNAVFPALATAG